MKDISSFHRRVKGLQNGGMSKKTFKIGTRGSPLALTQAGLLRDALLAAHPTLPIEIIPIKSAADWNKRDGEKSLCEQEGGKGQFAKEIEDQILNGTLDCGVHSLKDMASTLPDGLVIEHFMPRADPRDAFICKNYGNLMDLPAGAIVGTCSPRRKAYVLSKRPDISVVPFRGNVRTRLDKIENGQVDATYLAMAGLTRLGIADKMIHAVEIEDMLPACGQGIVCVEMRDNDTTAREILNPIHDRAAGFSALAEREFLRVLDGSCHTPIAAYAVMKGVQIYIRGWVSSPDGRTVYEDFMLEDCPTKFQAATMGQFLGERMKAKLPEGFLS